MKTSDYVSKGKGMPEGQSPTEVRSRSRSRSNSKERYNKQTGAEKN